MSSGIASRPPDRKALWARPGGAAARAIAAAMAVLGLAGAARAEPSSAADKAMAEALFRDGKQLLEAGKLNEGCGKLEESQRIDPKLGTLLNVATCHEQQGRTASAWAEFNEAASLATSAKQSARVSFARTHAADLEQRLSRLTIKIDNPPSGLAIKINGKDLSVAAIGSPIPVDPGNLSITVTAPGKKPWSQMVPIEAGPASKELPIPGLTAEAPALKRDTTSKQPPPPPPPPVDPAQGTRQRIAGVALAGVGLVGIGVGSYFGLDALKKGAEAHRLCPNAQMCGDPKAQEISRSGEQPALISTLAFIAGGTLVAGGAVLFLTAPSRKPARAALQVAPLISPQGFVLSLGGTME
jgi:hypothetical protein